MKSEQEIEKWLDALRVPSDEEVEAAGRRFDRRLRRMVFRSRLRWGIASAAAVLVAGWVVAVLWQRTEPGTDAVVPEVVQVLPKVEVPTLVLADGQSVALRAGHTGAVAGDSLFRIDGNRVVYDTAAEVREVVYNELVNPAGYTSEVRLADGTRVVLNAGSRLRYPVEFVGEKREVELWGEGYFEVAKSGKPFEVQVAGAAVRVYGTQFNVKETPRQTVETVLVEGSIGFRPAQGEELRLIPGEQVTYDAAEGNVQVGQVDTRYATAWLEGIFRYRDMNLALVLEDVAVWYGITFKPQADIKKIKVTMNLSKTTPVEEVLSFIGLMTDCRFVKERGCYVIKR